jgi:hypothetical protein
MEPLDSVARLSAVAMATLPGPPLAMVTLPPLLA